MKGKRFTEEQIIGILNEAGIRSAIRMLANAHATG